MWSCLYQTSRMCQPVRAVVHGLLHGWRPRFLIFMSVAWVMTCYNHALCVPAEFWLSVMCPWYCPTMRMFKLSSWWRVTRNTSRGNRKRSSLLCKIHLASAPYLRAHLLPALLPVPSSCEICNSSVERIVDTRSEVNIFVRDWYRISRFHRVFGTIPWPIAPQLH